jgi:hypothetical protein
MIEHAYKNAYAHISTSLTPIHDHSHTHTRLTLQRDHLHPLEGVGRVPVLRPSQHKQQAVSAELDVLLHQVCVVTHTRVYMNSYSLTHTHTHVHTHGQIHVVFI